MDRLPGEPISPSTPLRLMLHASSVGEARQRLQCRSSSGCMRNCHRLPRAVLLHTGAGARCLSCARAGKQP